MENTICFFDLETTGVSVTKDKIVQISCVKTDINFNIIEKRKKLVNPECEIPLEASLVHNIYKKDIENSPTFPQIAKGVYEFMKDSVICGYNILQFDVPFLQEEFLRSKINWDISSTKFIDPLVIFRNKERRDLAGALKFYCGESIEGAHDAENDVLATIKVTEGQSFFYDFKLEDLIKESRDESFLDLAGKIAIKDGVAVYNFGKDKGLSVEFNPGFGKWMLTQDFSSDTKNVVRKLIYGSNK